MALIIRVLLLISMLPALVLSLENPVYSVNNVKCPEFTVLDFYVYPYSDSYNIYYARIRNDGPKFFEHVGMDTKYYFNRTVVNDQQAFIDHNTYGSAGMLPASEALLFGYLDKAKIDSVSFNFSYISGDGSKDKFDEDALKIGHTLILPYSGSSKKITGSVKNQSESALRYPTVFICVYENGKCLLNEQTFLDVPNQILEPGAEATFYTFVDLPASYDSIRFVMNYDLSMAGTGAVAPIELASHSAEPYDAHVRLFWSTQNRPSR